VRRKFKQFNRENSVKLLETEIDTPSVLAKSDSMWNSIKKKAFYRITILVLLVCSLLLAFSIRNSNVPILGKKYLLGTDSYRFLRQADIIASYGRLPKIDRMRWNPLGRDLSTILTLWPNMIAGSYRLLRTIYSELTIYQVACYSGLICYLASLLFLYLLWKHIFDASVALLAVNLLAVFPSMALHRSCAGNADRDSFCLLLWIAVIYFYILAISNLHLKGVVYAFISGIIAGIFALTWNGCGLTNAIIACFLGFKILRNRLEHRDVLIYTIWLVCLISIALILTSSYQNLLLPYAFVAITFPTFVWLSSLIFLSLRKNSHWARMITGKRRIPKGVVSIALGSLAEFLVLLVLVVVQSAKFGETLQLIFDNFISPLGRDRLMRTVMELQSLEGESLVRSYYLIIITAIFGNVLLSYRFFAHETANFVLALVGFEIVLCGSMVSLFPPEKIANPIYYLSLVIGGIALFISYILGRGSKEQVTSANHDKILWVLIWLFIAFASSRQAKRFIFFLDPVIIVAVSYFIIEIIRSLTNKQANLSAEVCLLVIIIFSEFYVGFRYSLWTNLSQWLIFCIFFIEVGLTIFLMIALQRHQIKYRNRAAALGIALALILVISSDTFQKGLLHTSIDKASQMGPLGPQNGVAEIADYTDQDAVIAAWWGFGSIINWLSKRATIIDEDQWIPYWIHLMARHVFAAQSGKEALEFLYAHNASYLLITTLDLYGLIVITYNGSDASFDRLATFVPLRPVKGKKISTEEMVTHFLPQPFNTTDTLTLDGQEYPPGKWSIRQVSIVSDKSRKRWSTVIHGIAGDQPFSKPPREFRFKEHIIETNDGIPGSIIVLPSKDDKNKLLYISEKARNLLAVRLYLFQEDIPGFSLVYDTNSILPCEIDGLRLWKIEYPSEINQRKEYLATKFPEELRKSWQRGEMNF